MKIIWAANPIRKKWGKSRHYHIVFPVKYRKLLVDEEVVKIMVETAEEIQERFSI
jgi:hypothetical protein